MDILFFPFFGNAKELASTYFLAAHYFSAYTSSNEHKFYFVIADSMGRTFKPKIMMGLMPMSFDPKLKAIGEKFLEHCEFIPASDGRWKGMLKEKINTIFWNEELADDLLQRPGACKAMIELGFGITIEDYTIPEKGIALARFAYSNLSSPPQKAIIMLESFWGLQQMQKHMIENNKKSVIVIADDTVADYSTLDELPNIPTITCGTTLKNKNVAKLPGLFIHINVDGVSSGPSRWAADQRNEISTFLGRGDTWLITQDIYKPIFANSLPSEFSDRIIGLSQKTNSSNFPEEVTDSLLTTPVFSRNEEILSSLAIAIARSLFDVILVHGYTSHGTIKLAWTGKDWGQAAANYTVTVDESVRFCNPLRYAAFRLDSHLEAAFRVAEDQGKTVISIAESQVGALQRRFSRELPQ